MPDYIHRITFSRLKSVASADLPESVDNYIEYPDLTAVDGFPVYYWVITGDIVSLMSQVDRDAVDLAKSEADKDSTADTIDADPYLRAFALVMLDEINLLRTNAGLSTRTALQIKTAVRSKL